MERKFLYVFTRNLPRKAVTIEAVIILVKPFYKKKDIKTAKERLDKKKKTGWWVLENIKPYKYEEYWEYPKCYWIYKK